MERQHIARVDQCRRSIKEIHPVRREREIWCWDWCVIKSMHEACCWQEFNTRSIIWNNWGRVNKAPSDRWSMFSYLIELHVAIGSAFTSRSVGIISMLASGSFPLCIMSKEPISFDQNLCHRWQWWLITSPLEWRNCSSGESARSQRRSFCRNNH